jgi:hypothetical protein
LRVTGELLSMRECGKSAERESADEQEFLQHAKGMHPINLLLAL